MAPLRLVSANSSSTQPAKPVRPARAGSASRSISVSSPAIRRRNRAGTVSRLAASSTSAHSAALHDEPERPPQRLDEPQRRRPGGADVVGGGDGEPRPAVDVLAADLQLPPARRAACRGGRRPAGTSASAARVASAPRSVGVGRRRVDGDEGVEVVGRRRLGERALERRRRRDHGAVLEEHEARRGDRRADEVELRAAARRAGPTGRAAGRPRSRSRRRSAARRRSGCRTERAGGRHAACWHRRSHRSPRAARRRRPGRGPASGRRRSAPPSSTSAIATPPPRSSDGNGISRGSPR